MENVDLENKFRRYFRLKILSVSLCAFITLFLSIILVIMANSDTDFTSIDLALKILIIVITGIAFVAMVFFLIYVEVKFEKCKNN